MVRLVGLTLVGVLVAFQLWYVSASPSQRNVVPPWVRTGAGMGTELLMDGSDLVGDAVMPHWRRGWQQTKIGLGLTKAPEKPREGLRAVNADLAGQSFVARHLTEATFLGATLDGADFTKAYLVRAMMDGVSARDTVMREAVLERASLRVADLRGAVLISADLTGAMLDGTKLHGADLTGVIGLTQIQLDRACGDETTMLPAGLAIAPCPAPDALGRSLR